jgi:phosphoglucomutase
MAGYNPHWHYEHEPDLRYATEMAVVMGRDPGELSQQLTRELGEPLYQRLDAPAMPEQKRLMAQLSSQQVTATELAGEKISGMLTAAPGDDAPIGGLKVMTANGWFAARPSRTEDVDKIYAEKLSRRGPPVSSHRRGASAAPQSVGGSAAAAHGRGALMTAAPVILCLNSGSLYLYCCLFTLYKRADERSG